MLQCSTTGKILHFPSILKVQIPSARATFRGSPELLPSKPAGYRYLRTSLGRLIENQPVAAEIFYRFKEFIKLHRFNNIAIDAETVTLDKIAFFAG